MKKLNITKEQYASSEYAKKYGNLKFVSESSRGNLYKTDKGRILKFVAEAREYINDSSIDLDTVEEFIIFDDPTILDKIANLQKKEGEKIQDEVKDGEVKPNEVADAAAKAAKIGAAGQLGAAAISSVGNIVTNKAVLGLAAAAGYKKVLDAAGEIGAEAGDKVGDAISRAYYANQNAIADAKIAELAARHQEAAKNFADYCKISNLGDYSAKDLTMSVERAKQMDKRAVYVANQLLSGQPVMDMTSREMKPMSNEDALKWLSEKGYEINDKGVVNRTQNWVGNAASAGVGTTAAAGASAATTGGWSLFGLSAATVGWIAAGVAAAAVITPYIYDKVRACAKTWMADIIAEVKFRADGKNYRCFYDLKKNKWILTYADIKWSSYLDNKLDKETTDEFFASNFFNTFLDKCKKAFAMLFSTGRNEVVFKTLPEIKDAPKELKSILEKIYDNKGAISKNLFNGNHD